MRNFFRTLLPVLPGILCLCTFSGFCGSPSHPSGFEVTREGIANHGTIFLGHRGVVRIPRCTSRLVSSHFAIPLECLFSIHGMQFPGTKHSGPIAATLEIIFPSDYKHQEFLFSYSSSLKHGLHTPKVLSSVGLPRGQWTTMTIWLPAFKPSHGKGEDFGFGQIDWGYGYLDFCLDQKTEYKARELLENERNALLNCKKFRFNRQKGIYLRSLKLTKPEHLSTKETENLLTVLYPSLFDTTWSRSLLYFLGGGFLLGLLLRLSRRVSLQFLLGFLIPFLPLLAFLLIEGEEYLSTLRNSSIASIRKDMERDFQVIESLAQQCGQEYISKFKEYSKKVQKFIADKSYNEEGVPLDFVELEEFKERIKAAKPGKETAQIYQEMILKLLEKIREAYPAGHKLVRHYEKRYATSLTLSPENAGSRIKDDADSYAERADALVVFRNTISWSLCLSMTYYQWFYALCP
jgi:hypothetical protein